MVAGTSSQRRRPSIPPILVILLATLLFTFFKTHILSRIPQLNALVKIADRVLLFCNRILTTSLMLLATTRLLVHAASSFAFVARYMREQPDGRRPRCWTTREVAASLCWKIGFALASASCSRPNGSSFIRGTTEEIIAVLPFALCAPPVTIELMSLWSLTHYVYLWSRGRVGQINISRSSPLSSIEYILMTLLSTVTILVAAAVARLDPVYNREGPGSLRNLCAVLSIILKALAGFILIVQSSFFVLVIFGCARRRTTRRDSGRNLALQ
ncbi:hypothetical protein EV421DRAFT_1785798 [Armillaria borealis]|uniref:Uncharacterized protein n=1 Tax=Armillaria borealis TaxID=47425 RepID=A0AA39JUF3_9AGAR|nr:hypothetical protein EV421DRAFT_1785798 [Armillaria borealis]